MGSDEVDVVVVALQPDMGHLAAWRELLKGCHLIVVQGEEFADAITIPEGFPDVEVYTRRDMARLLGPDLAGALQFSGYGSRAFGYLVARRRYVFTMEADRCVPAQDPEGYVVNPVVEHVKNLKSPATPLFFNTLYDPYREGADFVRGYPFSMREGVATAISQGSWDSKRYVDATLTVPKSVLHTASAINLSFDRSLVGPLLFEPPALGEAAALWAGLCAKMVCDHYSWGVKTGLPYVSRTAGALADETSPTFDSVVEFFRDAHLSGNSLDVEECYLEIAQLAKSNLSAEVALSMQAWVQAWNKLAD